MRTSCVPRGVSRANPPPAAEMPSAGLPSGDNSLRGYELTACWRVCSIEALPDSAAAALAAASGSRLAG